MKLNLFAVRKYTTVVDQSQTKRKIECSSYVRVLSKGGTSIEPMIAQCIALDWEDKTLGKRQLRCTISILNVIRTNQDIGNRIQTICLILKEGNIFSLNSNYSDQSSL